MRNEFFAFRYDSEYFAFCTFAESGYGYIACFNASCTFAAVAGISFEIIKFAGRSKSKWVAWLSKPGLWLQKLTTREPDASQIEVAIESMKPCIPENKEDDRW